MENRHFDKAKRAAKIKRDKKISDALRATGRKPKRRQRKLEINTEFDYEDRKVG